MDFVKKVKGFLLKPSKTFDASYGDTLDEAVAYFMILTVIFSALNALLFVFTRRGLLARFLESFLVKMHFQFLWHLCLSELLERS